MSDAETMRQSVLQESDVYGSRRRFGLFSQPISTAVGDDGSYKKKIHPRDPVNNKPLTQPKNFFTSPTKKGQGNKQFFSPLNPLATSHIKDQYIEPGKRLLKEEKQKRDKGKRHQQSFFTGTGNKILAKPSYEYVEQKNPELDPKRNREEDGRVRSQPRNFYTNRGSTVQTNYFKPYKHENDPYDRAHKLQKQLQKRNRSLQGEQRFRPNSFSPSTFNSLKQVYGEDIQLKKREAKQTKLNIYNHENPWKSSNPNKLGLYGSFQAFPKYMENPPKEIKRKPPQEKLRENFKLNSSNLSTPTPSITLNRVNIRRSMGRH